MPSKKSLRAKILKILGSQSPEALKKRSLRIKKKLFSLAVFKKAGCVCFYVSLPLEVDTTVMIDKALRMGKRVIVPRTNLENKELSLYEIKNRTEDLKKGAYGVMEPRAQKTRFVDLDEVDCLIVPGVVFDKRNNRIGRGKGYYDRFLKKFDRKAVKIGLAFSFQVIPRVPVEAHDEMVDQVLTD